MSYSDLPNSFWGYALEIVAYILNLVPSKSVPTTPPQNNNKGYRKPMPPSRSSQKIVGIGIPREHSDSAYRLHKKKKPI